MRRRRVVQRWPAVPMAEKAMARRVRSRSAVGATMAALLPPSSRMARAKRAARRGSYGAAHRGGAGGGDEWDEGRVDELLADGCVADEEGGEAFGDAAEFLLRGALEDGLGGEGGEGSFFGGLPDDGVAADEGEGGVPAPDGDGEVEGGDDADDAEGVPGLHHAMLGALGGDGEAGELAGEAGGEGADVDHLLDFAMAFGEELAGFDGDEAAEAVDVRREVLRRGDG